jgi:hypothetical protein
MSESYYGKHCEEEQHLKVIKDLMDSNYELEQEASRLRRIVSNIENYLENAPSCEDQGCLWQSHIETLVQQDGGATPAPSGGAEKCVHPFITDGVCPDCDSRPEVP